MGEGRELNDVQRAIIKIAEIAANIGWQAGVGQMELAGQYISVLAAHPELVDRFLKEGGEMCLEGLMGAERGCLTFYNRKLEIVTPAQLRRDHVVRDLKRNALPPPPTTGRERG